jgi:hypothetical protein
MIAAEAGHKVDIVKLLFFLLLLFSIGIGWSGYFALTYLTF